MSETATYCATPSCGKLSPAGTLCTDCYDDLTQLVDNLPWALEQLQTTATNQVRFTTGGGSKSTEIPLLFNPYASLALTSLIATIHIWQGRLADHCGQPVRFPNPIKAARWINNNLESTHTFIDAGHMLDALQHAHEHTEHIINRPPGQQFLGDCATTDNNGHTCPGRMFAYPDKPEARCDTCGKTIDAARRRLDLLLELDDRKLSAAEIAMISTYMGLTINREQVRKRINQWHSRHRIIAADTVDGDPRFQFKEVRQLLEPFEETRQTA